MIDDEKHQAVQARLQQHQLDIADACGRIQTFFTKLGILTPGLKAGFDQMTPDRPDPERMKAHLVTAETLLKIGREHADDFIRMGQTLRKYADLAEPYIQELREEARAAGMDYGDST